MRPTAWYVLGIVWGATLTLAIGPPISCADPARPEALSIASTSDRSTALEPYMEVLTDRGDRLDLEAVRAAAVAGAFEPLSAAGANFGFTDRTVWLRFRIAPRDSGRFIVEIPYPHLDRVVLHVPDAPRPEQRRQRAGDRHPFDVRPLDYRVPAFPLALEAGEPVTAYLEIASSGAVRAPARIWPQDQFHRAAVQDAYVLGPYYGVLAAMGIYNLLLFVAIRDRNTLYYIVAIAAIGLFVFSYTGMAFELVWPQQPYWNEIAPSLAACLASLAVLQFSRSFLELAERVPRADVALKGLMGLAVVLGIGVFVLPLRAATVAVTLSILVSVAAIVVSAGLAWVRGGRQVRYFVAAWGIVLTGALITALSLEGLLPANAITRHAIPVGSAIEMIVLGVALADRIRVLREEKERIQADTMKRLLRELHDGMGRHFVKLIRGLDSEATPRSHLRADVRRAFVDMRLLVASADPPFRDLASGLATVREQYTPLLEDYGMQWDWRVDVPAACLKDAPSVTLNVLRIVQEALTNAIKYSGATTLTVEAGQAADGEITLAVADDGEGTPTSGRSAGGMAHMQQRASETGVQLRYDPETRTILLVIPPLTA